MNENYVDENEEENEEENELNSEEYYEDEEDEEDEDDEEENYYFPCCEKCNEICKVYLYNYSFDIDISCLNNHRDDVEVDKVKYKLITKNDYDLKKKNYKEYEVKNDIKLNFVNQDFLQELFRNIIRKYYPDKKNLFKLSSNENAKDKINTLINNNLKEEENQIIIKYLEKIYSFNYLLNSIKRNYNKLKIKLIETSQNEDNISIIYPLVLSFISNNGYNIPINDILNVKNYINYTKNNNSSHLRGDECITFCKYLPINNLICLNSIFYFRCDLYCCGASYRNEDDKYSKMFIINLNNNSFNKIFIDEVTQKYVAELKNNIILYCNDYKKVSIIKILPKSENNKAFKTLQVIETKNKIYKIFTNNNLLYIQLENELNLYKNILENNEEKFEYLFKQKIDLQVNEKVIINNKKILIVTIKNKDLLNIKEYDLFFSDSVNFNVSCNIGKYDKIKNIGSNIIYIYNENYIYFICLITHQVINKFTFDKEYKFIPCFYNNIVLFQKENCVKIAKFNKNNFTFKFIDEKILDILNYSMYSKIYIVKAKNKIVFCGKINIFEEEYGDYDYISEIKIFELNN